MPTFTTPTKYRYILQSTYGIRGTVPVVFASQSIESEFGNGSNIRTTSNNPNYRIQIEKRADASRPYRRVECKGKASLLRCETQTISGGVYHGKSIAVLAPFWSLGSQSFDSGLADLALTRLKRKLTARSESFNAMVPVGEFRDIGRTISGIKDLTTSVVKTLIDIKKTHGSSAFKYASKAWLTFSFGVSPMLRDVDQFFRAVSSFISNENHHVRLTGTASRDWIYSAAISQTGGFHAPIRGKQRFHHFLSYQYVAGVDLKIKAGNDYSKADHFGLTLPDLVPTLWELTAFSWVVDYFTNVGDWLEDVFVAPSGTTRYLTLARRYFVEVKDEFNYKPDSDTIFLSNSVQAGSGSYLDFERTVLNSLPHVGLRIRTPKEIANFGASKLLNLVSILGSR